LGSSNSVLAHVDDYFYYGGFDGILTKDPSLLVKDYIIGGVSYLHWFTKSPVPIVFKTGVTVGFKGAEVEDIYDDNLYAVNSSPTITFSSDVDVVGNVGLGFSLRNIDILVGIALDNSLTSSFYIEVR